MLGKKYEVVWMVPPKIFKECYIKLTKTTFLSLVQNRRSVLFLNQIPLLLVQDQFFTLAGFFKKTLVIPFFLIYYIHITTSMHNNVCAKTKKQ